MNSLRLLVTDDSATVRKLVEICSRRWSWTAESAQNGAEALERARASPPDVMLLDFQLPDMSGVQVCERLAEDPHTAAIPVLVISAKGPELMRQFDRFPNVKGQLPKPFTEKELVERLRRIDSAAAAGPRVVSERPATPHRAPLAAQLLFEVLKDGLERIPEWERDRGARPAAVYYAQRLLTPTALQALARGAAQVSSAGGRSHSPSLSQPEAQEEGPWFERAPGFSDRIRGQQLTARQRHVLALISGRSTLAALADRSGMPAEELQHSLYELAQLGLVRAGAVADRRLVVLADVDPLGFAKPLGALLAQLPRPLQLVTVEGSDQLADALQAERAAFVLVNPEALPELPPGELRAALQPLAPQARLLGLLEASRSGLRETLLATGFEAVLVKPVTEAELRRLFGAETSWSGPAPRSQSAARGAHA